MNVSLDSFQRLRNIDNAFRGGGLPTIERYPGLSLDVLLVRILFNMVLRTFFTYILASIGLYTIFFIFAIFGLHTFFGHILAIIGPHRIRFNSGYSTKTDRLLSAILSFKRVRQEEYV